jgi:TATA-box binding protein (TBP) (component of TFIID and TFIIIB)
MVEDSKVRFYIVEPCASSNAYEIKFKGKTINLDKVEFGMTLAKTPVILVSVFEKCSLTIYSSGRIMIKGLNSKIDADKLAEKVVFSLQKTGAIA